MVNPLDFMNEDEYNQAVHEEQMGYQGDPRRCPRHPNIVTSSPDGMHDAPCGACEYEMYDEVGAEEKYLQERETLTPEESDFDIDVDSESDDSFYEE